MTIIYCLLSTMLGSMWCLHVVPTFLSAISISMNNFEHVFYDETANNTSMKFSFSSCVVVFTLSFFFMSVQLIKTIPRLKIFFKSQIFWHMNNMT